jgi:hypothetical protein
MISLILAVSVSAAFLLCFWLWISRRDRHKFESINNHPLAYISEAVDHYADLPLGNYGVPLRLKKSGWSSLVEMVLPQLTSEGKVEYITSWYSLRDVEMLTAKESETEADFQKLAVGIAPVIQKHLQLEKEIARIREHYEALNDVTNSTTSSGLEAVSIDLYERSQVESQLKQLEISRDTCMSQIQQVLVKIQTG